MKKQDYEQLTLFQEDSRVSHSAKPGSDKARTMTVTSGLKCSESYANSGPLGCLVRMCLGSSIWHSTRCFLTWKQKGTKSRCSIFQLAVSMPRTEDSESLFWPTPLASSWGSTGSRKTLAKMAEKGMITEDERRQLSAGNCKANPQLMEWLMGYEQQFTKLIPTPRASDYKGSATNRFYTHTHTPARRVSASALRIAGSHSAWDNWPVEPGIPRVDDGVSDRVDRIKCLGNAVVPQQFYPFFAAIAEIEKES